MIGMAGCLDLLKGGGGDSAIDATAALPLLFLGGSGAQPLDVDGDGISDGNAYDSNGDGVLDAVAWTLTPGSVSALLDLNGDGTFDAIDVNGDGSGEAFLCERGGLTSEVDCGGSPLSVIAGGFDADGDGVVDISFQSSSTTDSTTDSGGDSGGTPATPAAKFIFVTDLSWNGNLGGLSGADAKCNADAAKPDSSTYKALVYGNAALAASQEYKRTDGTVVFTTDASANVPASIDVALDTSAVKRAWTGEAGNDCNAWTTAGAFMGSPYGRTGRSDLSTTSWFAATIDSCNFLNFRLYCVAQ